MLNEVDFFLLDMHTVLFRLKQENNASELQLKSRIHACARLIAQNAQPYLLMALHRTVTEMSYI